MNGSGPRAGVPTVGWKVAVDDLGDYCDRNFRFQRGLHGFRVGGHYIVKLSENLSAHTICYDLNVFERV